MATIYRVYVLRQDLPFATKLHFLTLLTSQRRGCPCRRNTNAVSLGQHCLTLNMKTIKHFETSQTTRQKTRRHIVSAAAVTGSLGKPMFVWPITTMSAVVCNLKIHYRDHKSPTLDFRVYGELWGKTLRQQVPNLTSFLTFRSNINLRGRKDGDRRILRKFVAMYQTTRRHIP